MSLHRPHPVSLPFVRPLNGLDVLFDLSFVQSTISPPVAAVPGHVESECGGARRPGSNSTIHSVRCFTRQNLYLVPVCPGSSTDTFGESMKTVV